jgi:hypothetical protein
LYGRRSHALPPGLASEWLRLTVESLSELLVSDERREWLLATYPPTDVGRPGIIHSGERRKAVRKLDDAPAEDTPELAEVAAD